MSASAVGLTDRRAARFYSSTIGKKAVMAVSGIVLFGFIIAHLASNLQIFINPQHLDDYGRFLRTMPALLWLARITLLVMVGLHIWSSFQLGIRKYKARPESYVKKKATESSYASRTMYWSGPIILAFVIYHLLDFTFGTANPNFHEGQVHANVIASFRVPVVSIFYIVAMALLTMHLYHGLWSMFQSLGMNHPRYTPVVRKFAALAAILIGVGFISIPLAVMTGMIS